MGHEGRSDATDLALARQHGEPDLAKKITDVNNFYVRLTDMLRSMDPTRKILLGHYSLNYNTDCDR